MSGGASGDDVLPTLRRLCAREALAILTWAGASAPVRMLEVTAGSLLIDMPSDRAVPIRIDSGTAVELVIESGDVRLGLPTRVLGPIGGAPSSLGAMALEVPVSIRLILAE